MKVLMCFIVSVFFGFNALGQTSDSIRSGRPGQGIGPYVVGTGLLQIQSGVDYKKSDAGNAETSASVFNNVLRLGLSEAFELSVLGDWQEDVIKAGGITTSDKRGVSQAHLGFRYNVRDKASGFIPAIGVQTRFKLKHVSSEYKNDQVAPTMMLVLDHSLCDSLSLSTNLGMDYSGQDSIPTYNYVLGVSHSLSSTFGILYEFYGNERLAQKSYYGGVGLSYLLNSDLQLDIYVSRGDNQGISELYSSLGVSWRTSVW